MELLTVLLLTLQQPEEVVIVRPAIRVEPRAALWWANLNGRFRADQGPGSAPLPEGTGVHLDGDLDIKDEEAFGYYELGFTEVVGREEHRAVIDRVTLSFWINHWNGETTLDEQEVFNGYTFAAGERVKSIFSAWSFGLDGAVLTGGNPDAKLIGAMTFGLRVIEVEAELAATGRNPEEGTRLLYLGPGFRGEWHPSPHVFGTLAGGVYFSAGDIHDHATLDFETWEAVAAEAAASIGFEFPHVRMEGGFRLASNALHVDVDSTDADEENSFSYLIGGPFVQVSVRW